MTSPPPCDARPSAVAAALVRLVPVLRDRFGALLASETALLAARTALDTALHAGRDGARELTNLTALAERHHVIEASLRELAPEVARLLSDAGGSLAESRTAGSAEAGA